MPSVEEVHTAAARIDPDITFSAEAAEYMAQAAAYQFNRMIEGLIREAKRAGVSVIDEAFLREIEFWDD